MLMVLDGWVWEDSCQYVVESVKHDYCFTRCEPCVFVVCFGEWEELINIHEHIGP